MSNKNFKCKQCGNCCLNLDAHFSTAAESDIQMWKANNRNDILSWVSTVGSEELVFSYDIWIDPETGDDVEACPWLIYEEKRQRYACSIHELKPEICRDYPLNKNHALETGCKGYK